MCVCDETRTRVVRIVHCVVAQLLSDRTTDDRGPRLVYDRYERGLLRPRLSAARTAVPRSTVLTQLLTRADPLSDRITASYAVRRCRARCQEDYVRPRPRTSFSSSVSCSRRQVLESSRMCLAAAPSVRAVVKLDHGSDTMLPWFFGQQDAGAKDVVEHTHTDVVADGPTKRIGHVLPSADRQSHGTSGGSCRRWWWVSR